MAMGAIIVEDEVQTRRLWKFRVQAAEESQELLMPVTGITFSDDAAFGHLQRGKEGGGPVAFVIVRKGAAAAWFERQAWLSAVESLDLTLFIHAKHHGVLRRSQIDADDVGELFKEFGVA